MTWVVTAPYQGYCPPPGLTSVLGAVTTFAVVLYAYAHVV